MKHVFFEPWVGKDYASGGIFGKRIMILGESHYCGKRADGCCDCRTMRDKDCSELTSKVMHQFLNRADNDAEHEGWMNTFTKFGNALTGRRLDNGEQKELWNSLLFYNYLQVALESPRQAGAGADYENSAEAFFEVLEKYRPEYIIAWGYRLWDKYMPSDSWEWSEPFTVNGKKYNMGAYILSDGTRVKAFPVKHPSSGYSWAEWHEVLQAFIPFAGKHAQMTASAETTVRAETIELTDSKTDKSVAVDEPSIETPETVDKIVEPAVIHDLPCSIFPDECSTVIDEPYSADMNAETLLPKIRKALCKQDCYDWEYAKDAKRTLGIIDKLARSVEVEHGQMLASYYLNTYCLRDKEVKTQVLNEPYEHSFSDAPENFDYDYDFEPSETLLCEGVEGICAFSAENKERAKEPYVVCPSCKGAGRKEKCSDCEGTGRIQYVDGYFASGEERIKTGICTSCSGTGKIECPECNGQGKIEIYAPVYTVVKSVKETTSQVAGVAYASQWDSGLGTNCYVHNEEGFRDVIVSSIIQNALYSHKYLRIRMQNRKKASVDNGPKIANAMKAANVSDLYNECEKLAKMWFDKHQRGALVSQHTRHYLLPVSRLRVETPDQTDFYLLPYNDKQTFVILKNAYQLNDTSVLKYLFYKLFK